MRTSTDSCAEQASTPSRTAPNHYATHASPTTLVAAPMASRGHASSTHALTRTAPSLQRPTRAQTPVDVTPLTEDDRAFVLRTWRTEGVVDNIDRTARLRSMALVSETLIDAPSMTVLVARPVGDPLTILGWIARDEVGRVHAVYVKPAVRGIGVASALMKAGACRRVLAYPLSVRGVPHHSWRHEPWHGWAAAIEAKAGEKR